jgi:short-subunit dehydrogenase
MTISRKGTAIVTDASSGIGAIYADRLARRDYDLVLVARNCERLHDLAKRLTHETGRTAKVVAADLGEKADLGRIETLLRSDLSISLLVNNAGVGVAGPLLESDVDKMEDMIALNVRALTRLTCAAFPGFVSRGRGTIINIASGLAIAPEILNGVYAGTKAFVLALSLSLHKELADKNVRVQFWEIAGHPIEHVPCQNVMQAGDMIDAALAGLDHDELVTLSPLPDAADWQAYDRGSEAIRQPEQVEAANDDA